ncbi:ATP-binding protein [Nocardioides sp. Leaf285]|uniref:ATP-binding protein n=1 Tax=Nocardioides sp. Leaf285 TaxID=1736322 RepID=UPI000702D6BD|nr:ATP-binding protein [Nocardioides sp. Leaf285]KQP63007.1 hypothetical protein ASF47_18520 [Nocardioides sp. Leaf285]
MIEPGNEPAWPTTLRGRLRDGRLQGVDGSLWLYRAVPLSPVVDAKSPAESLEAAEPILAMFEELADSVNVTVKRRAVAKGGYRQIHMLLVNVPQRFEPGREHVLSEHLRQQFPATATDRRLLLFGVRLVDKIASGGFRQAIDSVVETLVAGQTPLSDYDEDTRKMAAAMDRSGLIPISENDVRLANSWWNHGDFPDTPFLFHPDHLHVMPTVESMKMAESAGLDQCATWTPRTVPGTHAITFASVQNLDLNFVEPTDPVANWVSRLIDNDALCVSVRGSVEPGVVTRDELRRQRKRFIDDIHERYRQNKMQRSEQEEMLGLLEEVEGLYASAGGNPPPTVASASIVVGFNGQYRDVSQIVPAGTPAKLSLMAHRQNGAMAETWLCSHLRANPNLHDLPVQTLACSGMPSLSFVGDRDGALIGFTERDRQPAWVSPSAASATDASPIFICPGQTGSGKTVAMLSLADQFSLAGRPVVIFDPKQDSDHSGVVLARGGQVYSLDRLLTADGVFDPIRFSATPEVGVELASSMLMSINPWGTEKENMEVPLANALAYGVSRGASCIGEALAVARRDIGTTLPADLVERVEQLASSSAQFRAIVGVSPAGQSLSAAQGITLIKVGSAYLDLPEAGAAPSSLQQRIALALVRMVVFGSAMSVAGRDGVVMFDESWIILGAGRAEVERLGRLARSQQVLPMLFTQRVTDALNAGLAGYISRGLILPMEDPEEAAAACRLFKLEPTPERMSRLTAKATKGGTSADAVAPNWHSMRALRDPRTGKVLRGAIAIYADLSGRAIPVEVTLSPDFLRLASTNPEDIRRRLAEEAAQRALLAGAPAT